MTAPLNVAGPGTVNPSWLPIRKELLAGILVALMLIQPWGRVYASPRHAPPKLTVEAFQTFPHPLTAGETGRLTITIVNPSAYQPAQNIMLRFQASNGLVIPMGVASAFVEQLDPGERYTWQLPLSCPISTPSGYVSATVSMDYETSAGLTCTQSDTLVLETNRPTCLAYEPPQLPSQAYVGDNLAFSLELLNLGRDEIRNVVLRFDIPGLNCGGPVMVGTILPGQSGTASANLLVSQPDQGIGSVAGYLTISYEDTLGHKSQRRHKLSLELLPPESTIASTVPEPGSAVRSAWPYVPLLAILFALCVLCLAQYAYIRRIKRHLT